MRENWYHVYSKNTNKAHKMREVRLCISLQSHVALPVVLDERP